ncbi:MAG: hypothetical protein KU37_04285 [Sulfuricurvum sp. PC08-66]|nr:MAG: hypothetical protein KU37_04285 [Sulfuricurvum sp. PC08-66]
MEHLSTIKDILELVIIPLVYFFYRLVIRVERIDIQKLDKDEYYSHLDQKLEAIYQELKELRKEHYSSK